MPDNEKRTGAFVTVMRSETGCRDSIHLACELLLKDVVAPLFHQGSGIALFEIEDNPPAPCPGIPVA
jgi:hypothetical protein